jgi:hypothetical protein
MADARPNIILIMSDQQRLDRFGAEGLRGTRPRLGFGGETGSLNTEPTERKPTITSLLALADEGWQGLL